MTSTQALAKIVSKKTATDDERKQMQRIFEAFDTDHSNSIGAEELGHMLQLLNVNLARKDLHRLTRAIDANGDGQVTFDEFVQFLSLRVLESAQDVKILDTKNTVARALVGQNSKLESWIFFTVVKRRGICGKMLWVFWYTGLIFGLLSQQTLVPGSWWKYFSICGVLLVPLPCFAFLVLCVDLIKELVWQTEFWCVLILQLSWALVSVRLMYDQRCFFWLCLTPSIIVSALSDAYPAKFRSHFQKMFFSGLIISMIWWCLMITYSWNEPIEDKEWRYERLTGLATTGSVANVGTAMLFAFRNLWVAFRSPEIFVIIVSPTKTTHVHLESVLSKDSDEAARVTLSAAGVPRITFFKKRNDKSAIEKSEASMCKDKSYVSAVSMMGDVEQPPVESADAKPSATLIGDFEDALETFKMENGRMKEELRLLKEQVLVLQSQEVEPTPWRHFKSREELLMFKE